MKKWLIISLIVVTIGLTSWYFLTDNGDSGTVYQFTKVERGTLQAIVTSTGTLSAVSTVQVGTQVSGTVTKIFADFNDEVRAGQVVALIDTTFLAASLRDAQANMERVKAQYEQQMRELERARQLFDKKLNSQSELEMAIYNVDVAKANMKSSQSSLDRAAINLKYATVRTPISGTVIARNVDVGQTVAASLSAPTLFLIANDLAKMQIQANVDESDIGKIQEGQDVRFTVQAYSEKTFNGVVSQIRLQPQTIQNVVNYSVIVNVDNSENYLLPGMTATVEFITEEAEDVLLIANSALRIRPTEDMMAQIQQQFQERMNNLPDSVKQRMAQRQQNGGTNGGAQWQSMGAGTGGGMTAMFGAGGTGANNRNRNSGVLYYLDEKGKLAMKRVRTGITDGKRTEIKGQDLTEGLEVISRATQLNPTSSTSTSPFQQNPQGQQGQMTRRVF